MTSTSVSTQGGGSPASASRHTYNLWKAIFWTMISVLAFTATAIAGRACRDHLSPVHMVFYRNFISLLILLVAFRYMGVAVSSLKSVQPWLQWGRALVHFLGQWSWMSALLLIPLIELMALEFTFPLIVAILAPVLLGEQMTRVRLMAALLGFAGTLVIIFAPYIGLQAGSVGPSLNIGTLLGAFCALCFACNLIGTRYLTRRDSPYTLLLFMTVNHTVLALLIGGWTMKVPPLSLVPWILALGVASLVAHFALARALTYADAVIVAPLDFVRVPLMVLAGYFIYSEQIQLLALLGTVLVIAGNGINVWGEYKAKQASSAAPAKPQANS